MRRNNLQTLSKIIVFATAFSFLLFSCGNTETKNTEEEIIVDTVEHVTEEAKKLIYPMPTPLEVTSMLKKAGASYILDIANSTEKVDDYYTETGKAINLGIYGADMSYASTYNKIQETTDYFLCTKKLLDALDIQTPNNEKLAETIEANIENSDVLHEILTTSFHDTFEFLNKNGKGAVSIMILTGGWIESLYLSTELASLTENNKEIKVNIAKQKTTLKTLMPLLMTYKSNESIAEVINDLKNIDTIYSNINETDGKTELTKEQLTNISKEIAIVRNKYINKP